MRKSYGFSMVELIVSLFVSSLVVLAVAGGAKFLDTQKRISLGKNKVLEDTTMATKALSKGIRMAGFGLSDCPRLNLRNSNVDTDATGAYDYPLILTSGDDGTKAYASDTVTVLFTDSDTGISKTNITAWEGTNFWVPYNGVVGTVSGTTFIGNRFVLLSDTTKCDIYAVDGTTPTVDKTADNNAVKRYKVNLTTTAVKNEYGKDVSWSLEDAAVTTYNIDKTTVTGLRGVSSIRYAIEATAAGVGALNEYDPINIPKVGGADVPKLITSSMQVMKAWYLIDAASNPTYVPARLNPDTGEDWSIANLRANPAMYQRISGVRIYMALRSPVLQARDVNGNCVTTINPDTKNTTFRNGFIDEDKNHRAWENGPLLDFSKNLAGVSDLSWGCYNYQTYDFVVPLKNVMLAKNK